PDGEESTSINPRRFSVSPSCSPAIYISLFNVLNLLAQLVDDNLEIEADLGQLLLARLGAKGIGFAIEFLADEIEPPSDAGFRLFRKYLAGGCDMPAQPIKLFRNIGFRGEERELLLQPRRIEIARLQKLHHLAPDL